MIEVGHDLDGLEAGAVAPALLDAPRAQWAEGRAQFLEAVPPEQREAVAALLDHLHYGGSGLRTWLDAIVWRASSLPEQLPAELIAVYLSDAEAAPLHDCEDCGVAIPVRPSRRQGSDGVAERTYFPTCPACGGRTGWYAYCSKQADKASKEFLQELPHRKPR